MPGLKPGRSTSGFVASSPFFGASQRTTVLHVGLRTPINPNRDYTTSPLEFAQVATASQMGVLARVTHSASWRLPGSLLVSGAGSILASAEVTVVCWFPGADRREMTTQLGGHATIPESLARRLLAEMVGATS